MGVCGAAASAVLREQALGMQVLRQSFQGRRKVREGPHQSNMNTKVVNAFTVSSEAGESFHSIHEVEDKFWDPDYLAKSVIVLDVGLDKVLQIIVQRRLVKNGLPFLEAGKVLESEYPRLWITKCQSQSFNLVARDWCRIEWFCNTVKIVELVTYSDQNIAVFRAKRKQKLMLPLPGSRHLFSDNFICVERLFRCWEWVRETVESSEVVQDENVARARAELCDESFKRELYGVYRVMECLHRAIKVVDKPSPTMGKVYAEWMKLERYLDERSPDVPFSSEKMQVLKSKVTARKKQSYNDLIGCGYVLDPEFHGHGQEKDELLMASFQNVVRKFYPGKDKAETCMREWNNYILNSSGWDLRRGLEWVKAHPEDAESYVFWRNYGESLPLLQGLAIPLLSQVSSCSHERQKWEFYSNVMREVEQLGVVDWEKHLFVRWNVTLREGREDMEKDFQPGADEDKDWEYDYEDIFYEDVEDVEEKIEEELDAAEQHVESLEGMAEDVDDDTEDMDDDVEDMDDDMVNTEQDVATDVASTNQFQPRFLNLQ